MEDIASEMAAERGAAMATGASRGDFGRGIGRGGGSIGIGVGGSFNAGAANADVFGGMGRGGFGRHRGWLHQIPGHRGGYLACCPPIIAPWPPPHTKVRLKGVFLIVLASVNEPVKHS